MQREENVLFEVTGATNATVTAELALPREIANETQTESIDLYQRT